MIMLVVFFLVAAIGAIAFTITGYTKHQPIMALFGAAFFLLMGGIAYTQSTSTWDLWYLLMFVSFIFGALVAMVAFSLERTERATRRAKAAADKVAAGKPLTTQEQWNKDQQDADDLYHQTHLPRHSRK